MNRIRVIFSLCLAASFLAALTGVAAPSVAIAAPGSATGVVIAQVYGGGGNSGAYWKNDFIVLFNASAAAAELTGWSVQYASTTGSTWQRTNLAGSLQPGQFFLIQEAAGSGGTASLPPPDAFGTITMGGSAGKVALVRNQTTLSGAQPDTTNLEDWVGYGTTTDFYEGSGPTPLLSNTTAAWREAYGCVDTNDNLADFYIAAPQPFNTAASKVLCGELPSVTTTLPDDLATEVPIDSNIVVTFNELVNLTSDAITLACPSGSPVALSGLPRNGAGSVTIDPTTLLPLSTTCEATVHAAGVTDVDLVAEHPTADYVFSFTTSEAPVIAATLPADHATGVKLDADISITFSEPVTVSGDWYHIDCSLSGEHSAIATDADPTFTLNPGTDFNNQETCSVTVYAANVADEDVTPDNLLEDYVFDFTTTACGAPGTTLISAIQGTANPIALAGVYTVEAVVVGDYQVGGFGGFYIQEEDTNTDANLLTSEGLFVYYPSAPAVSVGDTVRLTGTTSDYYGLSQIGTITSFEVCSMGSPLPAAVSVDLPVDNVNDLERYEGMRVTFVDPLTVIETFELGRYGEMLLAEGGRIPTFTHDHAPSLNGYDSFLSSVAKRTILLDDGSSAQNPDPVIYPSPELTAANTLRMGDTIASLGGVLDYRFGVYRIQPTGAIDFVHNNPRPPAPANTSRTLKVASANVLNYFNTFTGCTNGIGGIADDDECRGADDAEEFARQRAKIIAELVALDADVVGLMEIENDGYAADSALQDLVNGLNAALGAGTYAFIDPDLANGINAMGTDYIRVAMLYKPGTVTPTGSPAVLNTGAFAQEDDITTLGDERRNRVPLAQTFMENATHGILTVVVNHLKSKGSACTDPTIYLPSGDPDLGDGQGNCNLTRKLAAQEQAAWLATDPTSSGDPDFLIIGDLNSYAREDPIGAMASAGYTNLLFGEYGEAAYGYVYDGLYGYLDHTLASPTLVSQVVAVKVWHNNADEPTALDYDMTFKTDRADDLLYAPDAYHASDHDPVVVELQMGQLLYLPLVLKP